MASFVAQWDKEKKEESEKGLLAEFLEYFGYFEEAGGKVTMPEEASNVQLMTVHAAKGLEFDHVFLFHLVRGAFPTRNRRPLISLPTELWKRPLLQGDFHLKEERRLFYVGLTRAKRTLTLCTISNDRQKPSPFVEELLKNNCPQLQWAMPAATPGGPPASPFQPGLPFAPRPFSRIPEWAAAPTAPDAENLSLSASGLETYLQCPLKYYYSHVWQVPVAPSAALRFGAIMHGAVKQLVDALARRPETVNAETIEAILREYWSPTGLWDPVQERKYREMGLQQLQGLWRTLSAARFDLLAQEKTFHLLWGGTRMVGRIDQINRIAEKDVELIEYKTGRPQTQREADRSRQLTIYAHACREVLGLAPVTIVLYNLSTQEALRTQRGPEDFRILEEEISQTCAGIAAGRFPPLPNYHCRYCDFRPICPAHEDSPGATESFATSSTLDLNGNETGTLLN